MQFDLLTEISSALVEAETVAGGVQVGGCFQWRSGDARQAIDGVAAALQQQGQGGQGQGTMAQA